MFILMCTFQMPRALLSLKKLGQMKRHITVLSLLAFVFASSVQGKAIVTVYSPVCLRVCSKRYQLTVILHRAQTSNANTHSINQNFKKN